MPDTENTSFENSQGEIVIYQADDGDTKIDVRFVDETVWLTQTQMAELFQSSRTNIVEHIQHIYEGGELDEASTCRKFRPEIPAGPHRRQQTGCQRDAALQPRHDRLPRLPHQIDYCHQISPLDNRALEGVHDQGLYYGRKSVEKTAEDKAKECR